MAPSTTPRPRWRPARRTLRSAPRLLAASRRFTNPRPRTPPPVAPLESGSAGGPPSEPSPEDRAAFTTLRPWAVKMASVFGARPMEVEDVAQEALLRAARGIASFLPSLDAPREVAVRRWITGIIANVLAEYRDKARRRPGPSDVAPDDLEGEDSERSLEARAELRQLLHRFSGSTSPERWRAWLAFEVDGVPVAEIARQEGAPQATIYTRIHDAREDLAAMLSRHEAAARGKLARDRMTRRKGRR